MSTMPPHCLRSNASLRSWWLLHLFLVALENCSFACPENEQYLVKLHLSRAGLSFSFGEHLVSCASKSMSVCMSYLSSDTNWPAHDETDCTLSSS